MTDLITTQPDAPAPDQLPDVSRSDIESAEDKIEYAVHIAKKGGHIIDKLRLYATIRGKKFITVEGYAVLAAMWNLGVREVSCEEDADGNITAVVELIRLSDTSIVGRGSAMVGIDEKDWAKRPKFQRRSMAITRATGKAYRLALSWIVKLAGYEPTPSVEVESGQVREAKPEPKLIDPTTSNTRADSSSNGSDRTITIDARFESNASHPATSEQVNKIRRTAARVGIESAESQRDLLQQFNLKKLNDATGEDADLILAHLERLEMAAEAPF